MGYQPSYFVKLSPDSLPLPLLSIHSDIEFIMEDTLEKASNEHRTIYYSSQLRVMDISQNIRSMGLKLSDN